MNRMKRYLLFGGDVFYPEGGWNDYLGSYDSVTDAMTEAIEVSWAHIVDTNDVPRIVARRNQHGWHTEGD